MTHAPARLGVILPDDGPQDYEWYALAGWFAERGLDPEPAVQVAGSGCDGRHTEASLRRTGSLGVLTPPARQLAEAGADALVWACTSGSFIGGRAWAEAQAEGLAEASGLPATSTALALVDAVRALGAGSVDLLSPYPADVTHRLTAFLAAFGIACADVRHLDCPSSTESHRLDLSVRVGEMPGSSRPLVIPDTAVNSLHRLDALEAAAGRPVVTANQASLWAGLRLAGASGPISRAGTLLAAGG
jgi:maleate isomerase